MICIGMSADKLNNLQMYDGLFNVYTDLEKFYYFAYDTATNILVITDDFISSFFKNLDLVNTITEIKKINKNIEIVLLGENIQYEVAGTYLIKEKWDLPTRVSGILSKLYNYEKSLSTDRNQIIYRDFKINSLSSDNMVSYILSNPNESMRFLRELLLNYKKSNIDSWALSNKVSSLALENKSLNDNLNNAIKHMEETSSAYNKIKRIHDELIKKINLQYNIPYEEEGNEGFEPAILNYDKILYIKEISPVKYTQTMIYYLQNIMNTVSIKHTRRLIIERAGSYMLEPLYNDFIPHYKLTHRELKYSDIFMAGYQKDIMLSILQNTALNSYLIIWDKTGTDCIYVKNYKVKLLYTMSDINENKYFKIPDTNILSYDKSVKHISFISNFESMDAQEKLKAYSSQPVIKELIKALEA